MDTVIFIRQSLQQGRERLLASLQGVTPELVAWRPTPDANSIGWLLVHIGLAEDAHMHKFLGREPGAWVRDRWYERLGVPEVQRAAELTDAHRRHIEGLGLEPLLRFAEAVRKETYDHLATLTPEDLSRVPVPQRPDLLVGSLFRHTINHEAQHGGQIDFIRGLRQAGWDMGMGVGMAQR